MPIFTNPGSMEAAECELTRGACFRRAPSRGGHGHRPPVDFVVCFGWGEFFLDFFFPIFFLLRTHTACCKYEAASCLIYLSTSNEAKKPLDTGVRTGCHYLICLSVCVCVCVTLNLSFLLIARAVRGRFPQTRYLWKRASMG